MEKTPQPYSLTKADLTELKAFIGRKGFSEPVVLMEILDHFACKVEELSGLHPDWSLDKRMQEAHLAFGAAGFYPLVKSYEAQLVSRYKRYFRKALLQVVTSVSGIGWLVLTPVLFYALTVWTGPFWQQLTAEPPTELAAWMVILALAGSELIQFRKLQRKDTLFVQAARSSGNGLAVVLYMGFGMFSGQLPIPVLLFLTVFITALQLARHATFRKAKADYEKMLQSWQVA